MRLMTITLTGLAAVVILHQVSAEDAPKRSDGWQVLDRWVGTWDLVVTHKPAQGEVVTSKTFEIRKWSVGGKFVHFENPHKANPDIPEFHMLLTYNPETKSYPAILMNGPHRAFVDGSWDAATETMRFTGSFPDGIKFDFKNQFIESGVIKAKGVFTDPAGKVFLERSDTQTRRKE